MAASGKALKRDAPAGITRLLQLAGVADVEAPAERNAEIRIGLAEAARVGDRGGVEIVEGAGIAVDTGLARLESAASSVSMRNPQARSRVSAMLAGRVSELR